MRLSLPHTISQSQSYHSGIFLRLPHFRRRCQHDSIQEKRNTNFSHEVSKDQRTSVGRTAPHSFHLSMTESFAFETNCFLDKSGFKHPCKHLHHCFGKGNLDEGNSIVLKLFEEARNSTLKSGVTIWSNFKTRILSDYEKAVFVYLK